MSRVEVDPDAVNRAAVELRALVEQLDLVAARVADALGLVAHSAGTQALQQSAAQASHAWGQSLAVLAGGSAALARATALAATAYRLVETTVRQRFDPPRGMP